MKKFMKAIAFVTVMCMALSTVAFATVSPVLRENEKVLDITVTGAGDNQVALLIVEAGATNFDDPLYIDQKASANGTVAFEAVLTNTAATEADIYVGYATLESGPAKVGKVALTKSITEVTISKVDVKLVEGVEGKQQIGVGAALELDVKAPDGVSATDMIWAIRYMDGDEEKVKYTESFDISDYQLGTLLKGSVTLGLTFLNGFNREGEEIASLDITTVDAIFMFTNGEVEFTNAVDANNKK